MNLYSNEIREVYQQSIGAFLKSYPCKKQQLIEMLDAYCRTCAMYIWSSFNVDVITCTDSINEIYFNQSSKKSYSQEQVKLALESLAGLNYKLQVPEFYKEIVAYDIHSKTLHSRKLASCLKCIFIAFAMADGKVEQAEAELIDKITLSLTHYCDEQGIGIFRDNISPFTYVSEFTVPYVTADIYQNEDCFVKVDTNNIRDINVTKEKELILRDKETNRHQNIQDEIEKLIGLESVKKELQEISNLARIQKIRKEKGLPITIISHHLVFSGNPGTGKTTVARLVAELYKELGIISGGQLIETSAKDLVAGYVGQTAIKTQEVIEKAKGGVLFIDEAYTLSSEKSNEFGQEAIDVLLKEMEDNRDDFVVIVAGYDDLMKEFVESNPGLKSRFNRFIHFDDYDAEELLCIFDQLCTHNAYDLSGDAHDVINNYLKKVCEEKDVNFANARFVRNLFESVIAKQASRIASDEIIDDSRLSQILVEDVKYLENQIQNTEESLEDLLQELNKLIGLKNVKKEINELINVVELQQRRKKQGLNVLDLSLHLVFMGNPGTGKTTVARYVAKIYKALGLVSKGQLIETDRADLVAGYVGQTALKTQEVISSALGGVLFIDEAYTLSNGGINDFGQEAIDTLLKAMEDNRENLAVIVAGYDDLMSDFISSNPGLQSRFNRYIHFDDYLAEDMMDIYESLCAQNQYELTDKAKETLLEYFSKENIDGNGRGVRNIFEKTITQQAKRIAQDKTVPDNEISVINDVDIMNTIGKGKQND